MSVKKEENRFRRAHDKWLRYDRTELHIWFAFIIQIKKFHISVYLKIHWGRMFAGNSRIVCACGAKVSTPEPSTTYEWLPQTNNEYGFISYHVVAFHLQRRHVSLKKYFYPQQFILIGLAWIVRCIIIIIYRITVYSRMISIHRICMRIGVLRIRNVWQFAYFGQPYMFSERMGQ